MKKTILMFVMGVFISCLAFAQQPQKTKATADKASVKKEATQCEAKANDNATAKTCTQKQVGGDVKCCKKEGDAKCVKASSSTAEKKCCKGEASEKCSKAEKKCPKQEALGEKK